MTGPPTFSILFYELSESDEAIFFIGEIHWEAVIDIIKTAADMQQKADHLRCQGHSIVLVPTMGFLHEGHLSLVREGRKHGDYIVLSIFVNPTQFGPEEDFAAYPRDFDRDVSAAKKEGVAAIFAPEKEKLYEKDYETYVWLENLPNHLCGLSRPTHFQGVATIVTKLFNIVKPHVAVFGEKDYQQLAVIRRMNRDLNMGIKIVGTPIVREEDGLAMSSRNLYLTEHQRESALSLYTSLQLAQKMLREGETRVNQIIGAARSLIASYPETAIDYITICDPETLENITTITGPVLMALAVYIGEKCRLIDNMLLSP